jgi:hypothetical protein
LTCGIAKFRQLHPRRASGGADRPDTVNFDQYVVDVDFDGGESEELAGARWRHREHSDRDSPHPVSEGCRSFI